MPKLFFILFAVLTIVCAVAVISFRKVIYCAFALLLTLFNIACLYILLGAEFLAAVQVLIYAGAVMILFVFTLMLIDLRKVDDSEQFHRQSKLVIAGGVLLAIETAIFVLPRSKFLAGASVPAHNPLWENNTIALGEVLFTEHLLSFEIASIVLLVAIISAVILGKGRLSASSLRQQYKVNSAAVQDNLEGEN